MAQEGRIYKTLTSLKNLADVVVNETYIGSAWEVDKIARNYPLFVIDNMTKASTYKEGVIILNLDVYIVDIYNAKQDADLDDYIIQLQSDMFNIGNDYLTYLDTTSDYDFVIHKSEGIVFTMFREKWLDEVAGVKFELNVRIPDAGHCENMFN